MRRGPPGLGLRLLRYLLPPAVAEPMAGDLEEGFRKRMDPGGPFRRLRTLAWFWWQVVRIPYWSLGRRSRRLSARRMARERGGTGPSTWTRMTGGMGMGGFALDLRVTARTLLKRPAFAAATVLTLSLTIGAATLLFSVTEGVILRPLPYDEPDRVVKIYLLNHEWREGENALLRENWDGYNVSPRHVEAFRLAGRPLTEAGFWTVSQGSLILDGREEPALGVRVDEGVFPTLGVEPALGRLPTDQEHATGSLVAVLRHDLWQEVFGGEPEVLGRTFEYRGSLHTIVGVMPPGFFFPSESIGDFWSPVPPSEADFIGFAVGRLAPGVTPSEASVGVDRIARRLGEEDPAFENLGARAVPALEDLVGNVRVGVLLLLVAALTVLLVACVNLANLVLARGTRRRGELAVRAAIGAPGSSLVRIVFLEVWLVCLVGGLLGIGAAALVLEPFVAAVSTSVGHLPRSAAIGLNPTVLAFALGTTLMTALLAGVPAAVRAARRPPADSLGEASARGGHRSGRRARNVLLATQVALAALLLSGAGLLVRSALRAGDVDPGFRVDGLVWMIVDLGEGAEASGPGRVAMLEAARTALEAMPEVESAAFASTLPIQGGFGMPPWRLADATDDSARPAATMSVTAGYFATLGVPLLEGRVPDGRIVDGEPLPVLVTESFARALAPSGSVIGRRLVRVTGEEERLAEVHAVVPDARQFVLEEPVDQVYVVDEAVTSWRTVALARTSGSPDDVMARTRAVVTGAVPTAELGGQGTLRAEVTEATRHLRLRALLMAALAAVAALLAVVGIAGIATWYLAEQRHEIAVRMAVGARPNGELLRVVRHAVLPAALGILAGLLAALPLAGWLGELLFETPFTDPVPYVVVGTFLLVVAVVAAWLPGRRATSLDPAAVLGGRRSS